MIYALALLYVLLSASMTVFASQHDIKNVELMVFFGGFINRPISTPSLNNVEQCLNLGIKCDAHEPFIPIKRIRQLTIDDKLYVVYADFYNIVGQPVRDFIPDEPVGNLWFVDFQKRCNISDNEAIELLKKEHGTLLAYIQKVTSDLSAIPVSLLTKQFSESNSMQYEVIFHRASVRIGQETFNIIMSMQKEQLEQIPFDDWLKEFNAKKMVVQEEKIVAPEKGWSFYFSYCKKPLFGLLLIIVGYSVYQKMGNNSFCIGFLPD
jgi:hypothetical protein